MQNNWYKLDTAGLIFPAIRRHNWINVYRQSVSLTEKVDVEVLQSAVNHLQKRFPSLYVSLHSGFFWNYLEAIKEPIEVKPDYAYPLTHMGNKEIKTCCLRVLYHHNRIAIEVFHAITDGTGASIYLRSLVGEYIRLKYAQPITYSDTLLNPEDPPTAEELEDSFFRYSNGHRNSRKEEKTFRLSGTKEYDNGFLTLTTGIVETDQLLKLSHKYHCTVTALLVAVMLESLIIMQKQQAYPNHQKWVKVSVAANLRKIFGSKTLRNFVLAENVGVDPLQGEYTLEELCKIVSNQMALGFTRQNMASAIASNVLPQQNPIVRIVPLPIKHLIMDMVYASCGERYNCINISNLGVMDVDASIAQYIERYEFIVGVQRSYPNNCAVATIGNTTCINMIRSIKESEIERLFFSRLVELGIPVSIESNRRD